MQIVLNLDEIDLADWIDWDSEDTSVPQLSEIFIGEIKTSIINQLMDTDLKFKVFDKIDPIIQDKAREYVNSGAMKEIIEKRVKEKPLYGDDTLRYYDSYKEKVTKEADIYIKKEREKLLNEVDHSIYKIVRENFEDIFKNVPMAKYIDKERLSCDVSNIIKQQQERII